MELQHQEEWQSLLQLGNDCFHSQEVSHAEFFYSEAYDLLAFAYRNDPESTETLMAWICACHNLSTLYESQENMSLALRFLMVPHEYLLQITHSKIDNEAVKLVAIKGLSLTLSPILMFSQRQHICDSCIEDFESLKQLLAHHKQQNTTLLQNVH